MILPEAPVTGAVGLELGESVGDLVGLELGESVGDLVGSAVGDLVGSELGETVGKFVGFALGEIVGSAVQGYSISLQHSSMLLNRYISRLLGNANQSG